MFVIYKYIITLTEYIQLQFCNYMYLFVFFLFLLIFLVRILTFSSNFLAIIRSHFSFALAIHSYINKYNKEVTNCYLL